MRLCKGRRARSADDKELRRESLLAAARTMLERQGVDAFTMAALAQSAGVAKGTAYIYFPTREALFLDILIEELEQGFTRIVDRLQTAHGVGAEAAATVIGEALAAPPLLLALLRRLHGEIERNIPEAKLVQFKTFLLQRLTVAGGALEAATGLARGAGVVVFLRAHALAVGLAEMTNASAEMEAVFRAHSDLGVLALNFEREFAAAVADQIRALMQASKRL